MAPAIDSQLRDRLVAAATEAAARAYAPYSDYPVGAALLTVAGNLFAGCNVENASYGLAICGERNAIFHAVAEEGPEMRIAAIAALTSRGTAGAPCGACRQVIWEFGREAMVFYRGPGAQVVGRPIGELLPGSFSREDLPAPEGA